MNLRSFRLIIDKKISLTLILIILAYLSLFILTKQIFAASIFWDVPPPPPDQAPRLNPELCGAPPECANSQNTDNCGLPACSGGNAWSKYSLTCVLEDGEPTGYYQVGSQICSIADKCQYQPSLRAGRCDCSTGGTYKTCCTGDGNVNGSCVQSGPQDNNSPPEGSCPGGSTTVMCGVSSGTCNAVYPYPCTTASCGGDACSILRPEPPPPPDPEPPPPSGACQCTYGESCITTDGRAGSRRCPGINDTSSGTAICKWDASNTCFPTCTQCRANAQIQPGGNTGGGSSAGPSDVRIYVEPITSLKDKSLLVTATLRGNCKSNVRLRTGNKTNINGRECWVGGFNTCNCKVRTKAEGCPNIIQGCSPHDDDRSKNPKDSREGWGQWICPAENTGSYQATIETYAPFGEECTESTPYTINQSARIIGRFFMDNNGDGVRQAGEALIKQLDNLCRDLNGNGTCDSGEPKDSCSGFVRGDDAWVEVNGQTNRKLSFCDAGGPYFDFGILPTGTYTVRFRNQDWNFTTQSDFTENISGRREFLFGSRFPPCTNTTPGNNQLTGCLWDGINFNLPDGNAPTGSSVSSDNATALDQNWYQNAPNSFVGVDQFSARWRGNFTFKTSGTYTFYAGADDGIRLKIDGTTIIDSWIDTGYFERASTPYKFVSAGSHLVELEYYENGWDASASLRWTFAPVSNAWIQTIGGDVHSNVSIDMGGGP